MTLWRLKPFEAKKLFWPISLRRKWPIGHRYWSCHIYIYSRPKKLSPSPRRSGNLSTLLEKQQAILERVKEQQSRVPERSVPPRSRIEELQRKAFNILPGTVNARRGAAAAHASVISQDIPVIGRSQFENELAEEATWNAHQHP